MAHAYLFAAFALFGLALGSFLNVCIARLPEGESVARPRSKCRSCGTAVRVLDNIPVLSWFLLRGRCRSCKESISLQYPIVELLMGLWLLLLASRYVASYEQYKDTVELFGAYSGGLWAVQTSLALAYASLAILGFLLLGLMVMDWRHGLLPDAFTYSGMFVGLLLYACGAFLLPADSGVVMLTAPERAIALRVLAIAAAAMVLLLVRWIYWAARKREGMGLGDVKLLAMIAAFLGFKLAMLSLFFGVVSGALFAVGLVAVLRLKKAQPAHPESPGVTTLTPLHPAHMHVPFGSFLCAAGLFSALYGDRILRWYVHFWR